jgi:hypothetical protein
MDFAAPDIEIDMIERERACELLDDTLQHEKRLLLVLRAMAQGETPHSVR